MSKDFIPMINNQSTEYRINMLVYYKAYEDEAMSLIMIAEGFLPFILGKFDGI